MNYLFAEEVIDEIIPIKIVVLRNTPMSFIVSVPSRPRLNGFIHEFVKRGELFNFFGSLKLIYRYCTNKFCGE